MVSKQNRHTLQLFLTLASLLITTAVLSISMMKEDISWAIPTLIFLGWICLLGRLITQIKRPFRQMNSFLSSLRNRDFTTRFSEEKDPLYNSINHGMNETLFRYRKEYEEIDAKRGYYDRIVNVMSHELRNSVAPIVSLSDNLLKENIPDKTREQIAVIHEQAVYISDFLDSYHELTHIPQPQCDKVAARVFFGHIKELMEAERGDIKIDYRIANNMDLYIDSNLMTLVFINLVRNALQSLRTSDNPNPQIIITATAPQHKTYIRVEDNGPGFNQELTESIFLPYYSTKVGGTGIGLYLARQIVLLHGGNISATSIPGSTTFAIELP